MTSLRIVKLCLWVNGCDNELGPATKGTLCPDHRALYRKRVKSLAEGRHALCDSCGSAPAINVCEQDGAYECSAAVGTPCGPSPAKTRGSGTFPAA